MQGTLALGKLVLKTELVLGAFLLHRFIHYLFKRQTGCAVSCTIAPQLPCFPWSLPSVPLSLTVLAIWYLLYEEIMNVRKLYLQGLWISLAAIFKLDLGVRKRLISPSFECQEVQDQCHVRLCLLKALSLSAHYVLTWLFLGACTRWYTHADRGGLRIKKEKIS